MKKVFKIYIFILLMFVFNTNVFALCNDKSLMDSVENIKVSLIEDYEYTTKVEDYNGNKVEVTIPREYGYVLAFTPYIDGIKIGVTNSLDDYISYSEYSEKFDTNIIGSDIHYDEKKYNIKIYSINESSCYKELLREFDYIVPSFNEYSLSEYCENNPKSDLCKIDADVSKLSEEEVERQKEKDNMNNKNMLEKIIYNIKTYWYLALIPAVIISIYNLIKIHNYKKR